MSHRPDVDELAEAEHEAPNTECAKRPGWKPAVQSALEFSCPKPRTRAGVANPRMSHTNTDPMADASSSITNDPINTAPEGQQLRRSSTCYAREQQQ